MDTFDESFLLESDTEEEKNSLAVATREQLIFLLLADPALVEQSSLEEEEYQELSWVEVACRIIAAILRQKILSSNADETATIFFSTKHRSENAGAGEFTYVLQELGAPDASRIQQLERITPALFLKEMGLPNKDDIPEPGAGLKNALWQANLLTSSPSSKGSPKVSRRVLVFAPDTAPAVPGTQIWKGLLRNAEELAAKGATLQVIPLTAPGEHFAAEKIWQQIFDKMDETVKESSGGQGARPPDADRFGKIQDLQSTVRLKAHPQRSLGTYRFMISEDLTISVAMYATLQPATKQKSQWVHAVTNAPLTIKTALIDTDTGAILGENQRSEQQSPSAPALPKYYFPNTKISSYRHSTFPKVYLERSELDNIRRADEPRTFRILGFKSLDSLKDYHQLRSSSFIYPDEGAQSGSSQVFIALHSAMLEMGRVGIASFCRSRQSSIRLVALVAQEEEVDQDGVQVTPPGMHVIYLPFLDDIRSPETELAFTGTLRVQPTQKQVAAADALISNLQLGAFYSDAIANPHLQRHYQVLEAVALGEDPDVDIVDDTLPDVEAFQAISPIINAFKEAVTIETPQKKTAARPSKRKAQTVAKERSNSEDGVDPDVLEVENALQEGHLERLGMMTLKQYLKSRGLHVSGRKAELIDRIKEHVSEET